MAVLNWAPTKGGIDWEGVKVNFPLWEKWEKPPMIVEAKKERPTLEVIGGVGTIEVTKYCEAIREGEKDTSIVEDSNPWLVAGSYEPPPEVASMHNYLLGG